ncbi:transcription termination/antitermination NusG family protein [uncultured Amaricoccus sp.]|uniref:transcription termination/antitermination protein NusG n=1 Tax=uncultured Amaricoccus sp. TaxID=339341 RepID=UPI00260C9E6F|nr:transcription termination/antitermination NusG family protein [uncultured Amaricoccus sp.]
MSAWYALRVDPRHPSVGGGVARRRVPRLPTPVPVDGRSAVETREPPRAEFVVEAVLGRRGIEAWVPVESRFNRANRYQRTAKVLAVRPVLAGYVFVVLDRPAQWDVALACPMVRGVMGFGGVPARLPEAGIARLREIEAVAQARAHHRLMPTGRAFEVGEVVELIDGPMEGRRVEVIGIEGDRARVFCEFFGGVFDVTIGLDRLGAVV